MINVGMNVVILDLGEYNKMQKMMRDMEVRIKKYENAIKLLENYDGTPRLEIDIKIFKDVVEQKFEESKFVQDYELAAQDEWWNTTISGYGIWNLKVTEDDEPMTKEDFEMFMEEAGPDNDVEVKKDV